jgi:hypothetical protein
LTGRHASFSAHVVDLVDGEVFLISVLGASILAAHGLVDFLVLLEGDDLLNHDEFLSRRGGNEGSRGEGFEHWGV